MSYKYRKLLGIPQISNIYLYDFISPFPVLARPSFIITIVKKRYSGRAIVFASVSVCQSVSVPIEGLI
jgi:hypothetical protein